MDIQQTLQNNIANGALSLAADVFPGPVQRAISDYLNGIAVPIGPDAQLTVSTDGAQLVLAMTPVTWTGAAGADGATLQIAGIDGYADAAITVGFTKTDDGGVQLALGATMGPVLTWPLSNIWPALLNRVPFTGLQLAQGQLTLTTSSAGSIDFTGSGALAYQGADLATGAVQVLYQAVQPAVLVGVVVPTWSPGSLWSALDDVTFQDSGLLFSTVPLADAQTLTQYNLISPADVPAIVAGNFTVSPGVTFFTSLNLDKFLAPLTHLLGESQVLALYANKDLSSTLTIQATYAASFQPSAKAIFEFEGFSLDWVLGSNYSLQATAKGIFSPPKSTEQLTLALTATIDPRQESIQLALSIDDWAKPFGYSQLTVNDLMASVTLGDQADGVTLGLAGDFSFTALAANGTPFTFEFGVGGAITDFETPTGLGFVLQPTSQGTKLTLSELVKGISTVDVSSVPPIAFIDEVLQVQNFDFAVVLANPIQVGSHTFEKGFTLLAEFDVLNQENVTLNLEFTTDDPAGFTAEADLAQPVSFGKVLLLCGYDETQGQPDHTVGPKLAVTSAGPQYFYLSAYVQLLDVLQAALYGNATDSLFVFSEQVQAGSPHGTDGTWAGDAIAVGLDPKQFTAEGAFAFDFGWQNVTLGPVDLFGEPLIPAETLPNFLLSAGLSLRVDGHAGTFLLTGELQFDFVGLQLNYGSPGDYQTIVSLALTDAPATLGGLKAQVWAWLQDHLQALLEAALNDVDTFKNWVQAQWDTLGLDATQVARVLDKTFGQASQDIADFLYEVGYSASAVYHALVDGLNWAVADATKLIQDLFSKGDCAPTTATHLIGH